MMVDRLIVVVEPGRRSLETARSINVLAKDIGLENIAAVGNKVRTQSDRDFLTSSLPDLEFLGFIPYDRAIVDADLANQPLAGASMSVMNEVKSIYQRLATTKETAA